MVSAALTAIGKALMSAKVITESFNALVLIGDFIQLLLVTLSCFATLLFKVREATKQGVLTSSCASVWGKHNQQKRHIKHGQDPSLCVMPIRLADIPFFNFCIFNAQYEWVKKHLRLKRTENFNDCRFSYS
ncbi:hypothetical protein [Enterovibrio baiacu]|uniref:hypothetical protein n=1 Tax=Enterovibrio baiacu TaxID=2491023 RepID=UPI003D123143